MTTKDDKKVIGYRQSVAFINEKKVRKAYLADDVEDDMKSELLLLLDKNGIDYEFVSSKQELGKIHGINVGASIVCFLN